ncbi:MAG: hypothetical protein RLN62_06270 [Rickettsiales bacterium]
MSIVEYLNKFNPFSENQAKAEEEKTAEGGEIDIVRESIKNGDYEAALSILSRLKDQGDNVAKYYLGLMYMGGHGVDQDCIMGVDLFNVAHMYPPASFLQASISDRNLEKIVDLSNEVKEKGVLQVDEDVRKACEAGKCEEVGTAFLSNLSDARYYAAHNFLLEKCVSPNVKKYTTSLVEAVSQINIEPNVTGDSSQIDAEEAQS